LSVGVGREGEVECRIRQNTDIKKKVTTTTGKCENRGSRATRRGTPGVRHLHTVMYYLATGSMDFFWGGVRVGREVEVECRIRQNTEI
jgi:hypothetical protein